MFSYGDILEDLKKDAVALRVQIEKCRNLFRKKQLIQEYAKLIQLLALKPKHVFLCRCGEIEGYITRHGIEIEHSGRECLIVIT